MIEHTSLVCVKPAYLHINRRYDHELYPRHMSCPHSISLRRKSMKVGRAVRFSAVLALLLALVPAFARAQGQSGTIAGVVKDATGAVLPGVTVEVASPALIEKVRTAVTD